MQGIRQGGGPPLERPVLAVDVVLVGRGEGDLMVLLTRRPAGPFIGMRGLPGVAVRLDETLEQAALRALRDKAAVAGEVYLEQLATFDALSRDPRGRTVSVAYLGLARDVSPAAGPAVAERGGWQPLGGLARGSLPFDHEHILQVAIERLRGKLRYTDIAGHLLAQPFRVDELRAVYEAILGRRLNRSNFRTKLEKIGLIERVGRDPAAVGPRGGRPPNLYRFSAQGRSADGRDFL